MQSRLGEGADKAGRMAMTRDDNEQSGDSTGIWQGVIEGKLAGGKRAIGLDWRLDTRPRACPALLYFPDPPSSKPHLHTPGVVGCFTPPPTTFHETYGIGRTATQDHRSLIVQSAC